MKRLSAFAARHRSLVGKFAFELVIIFVGVTAAFALENFRERSREAAYRGEVIAALIPTLANVASHGRDIDRDLSARLAAFDAARFRGERPPLPVYREPGAERPPTRVWDSVVATGATRALKPELLFRLSRFYNRLDSIGDRYVRYNAITESRVYGLDGDQGEAYQNDGRLKPEFQAYVAQLRAFQAANREVTEEASGLLAEFS